MKLYLGPYKTHFSVYNLSDLLKYIGVSKDRRDIIGDSLNDSLKGGWLENVFNWINKRRKRRTYIKIDPYDVWSLDTTLAFIIVPALKKLKYEKHGSPFVDDEDVPDNIKSTAAPPKENEWDIDEFQHDRWEYVIDEMIWAMEQINNDNSDDSFFNDSFPDGFDKEGIKKHQNRIDNGTRLFGKYFRGLWS